MCEVARLSMSRHFDFSSCGHFSCRSVDTSRVNLMTTFGLVFKCVRYKDGSNHLRNSAAPATHLTTSSLRQSLSTMQFLKSSVLLVLAFGMHASAQDCIKSGGACQYNTDLYAPCCDSSQTCFQVQRGVGIGFVSTFFYSS
jgi:hypothetical protein